MLVEDLEVGLLDRPQRDHVRSLRQIADRKRVASTGEARTMSAAARTSAGTSARAWMATATPSVTPARAQLAQRPERHRVTDIVAEHEHDARLQLLDEALEGLALGHGAKRPQLQHAPPWKALQHAVRIQLRRPRPDRAVRPRRDQARSGSGTRPRVACVRRSSHGSWTTRGISSASRSAMWIASCDASSTSVRRRSGRPRARHEAALHAVIAQVGHAPDADARAQRHARSDRDSTTTWTSGSPARARRARRPSGRICAPHGSSTIG